MAHLHRTANKSTGGHLTIGQLALRGTPRQPKESAEPQLQEESTEPQL
jgi:hypothetical protein